MKALEEKMVVEEAQRDVIQFIIHHIVTTDEKPNGIIVTSMNVKMHRPYRTSLELTLESKRSLTRDTKSDIYNTIHDIVSHNMDDYDPRPSVTVGTSKKRESGGYETLVMVELYPDGEYGL